MYPANPTVSLVPAGRKPFQPPARPLLAGGGQHPSADGGLHPVGVDANGGKLLQIEDDAIHGMI